MMEIDQDSGVNSPYDHQIPSTSSSGMPVPPSTPQMAYLKSEINTPPRSQQSPYRNPPSCAMDDVYQRSQKVVESSATLSAHTSNWLAGHTFANYEPVNSPTPSVISTRSMQSCMTGVSRFSALTINTKMTGYSDLQQVNMEHQEGLLPLHSASSATSSVENHDPPSWPLGSLDQYVERLAETLLSNEPEAATKASSEAWRLAISKKFASVDRKAVRNLIISLLRRVGNPKTTAANVKQDLVVLFFMTACRNCLAAMSSIDMEDNRFIGEIVCSRMRPKQEYTESVFTLLTPLIKSGNLARSCRNIARSTTNLDNMVACLLDSTHDRFKRIVLECLKIILTRHNDSKEYFTFKKNGMKMLLNFVANESNEGVLNRTVQTIFTLLTGIVSSKGTETSKRILEHFVEISGIQILSQQLSHGSSYYLYEVLKCLKEVSYLDKLSGQNLDNSIGCILRLIGTNDPIITSDVLDILTNMAARKTSVDYMVSIGAPTAVLGVLETIGNFMTPVQKANQMEELLENIRELSFKYLSLMVKRRQTPEHDEVGKQACYQIYQKPNSANIILGNLLIATKMMTQAKAMYLISCVCVQCPYYINFYVDAIGYNREKHAYNLVKFAMRLLWTTINNNQPLRKDMDKSLKFLLETTLAILMDMIRNQEIARIIVEPPNEKYLRQLMGMVQDIDIRRRLHEFIEAMVLCSKHFAILNQRQQQGYASKMEM